MSTSRVALPLVAVAALAAALAPRAVLALVNGGGSGPVSGLPLTVEPSPPFAQVWLDVGGTFDGAPLGMTLSDGGRWQRSATSPRTQLSGGVGVSRFAAALDCGTGGSLGVALQADLLRRGEWKLGTAAAARSYVGGGWDLSVVPVIASGLRVAGLTLVPFGAARVRWARTPYDVQGWDDDRSSPFASAMTRDVALAPMVGVAAVTRLAELRLTAGWEVFLVNRLEWEQRPTAMSRAGGPFAAVLLRLRVGDAPRRGAAR